MSNSFHSKSDYCRNTIFCITLILSVGQGLIYDAVASEIKGGSLKCNNSNELLKMLIVAPRTIDYYWPGGPEYHKEYYSLGEPLTHAESDNNGKTITTLNYSELSVTFSNNNNMARYLDDNDVKSLQVNRYHRELDYRLSSSVKNKGILKRILAGDRQELIKTLGNPIDENSKGTKYICEDGKRKYLLKINIKNEKVISIIWTYK